MDLFVRKSNELAINLYTQLGYTTYRRVIGYYSGQEDALGTSLEHWCISHAPEPVAAKECVVCADMRKSMARDVNKESIKPLKQPIKPQDLEFD